MTQNTIRIGTRGSKLALAQAQETKQRLLAAFPDRLQSTDIDIIPITTSGDRNLDVSLSEIGGKGLFTKEIEEALLAGNIDIGVHSMKDMETHLPDGLCIMAVLEREDPRDALISPKATSIADLPPQAVFGTSSLRRAAQILMLRPDCKIIPFRGNVPTRLKKIAEGQASATMLAIAGLKRIQLDSMATAVLDADEILPAVAQGAIGLQCRSDDVRMQGWLAPLDHAPSHIAIDCERKFLSILDGSCRTPIAALAEIHGEEIYLRGLIAAPDGSRYHSTERRGSVKDALALGEDAGKELLRVGGGCFKSEK